VYAEQCVSYELAWVDRAGGRVERLGLPQPELQCPALSPDGQRVVVAAADEARVQDRDLWVIDVATGRRSRLYPAPTATRDLFPTWAPDGRSLVYLQARRDPLMAVSVRLDGSGADVTGDVAEASGRASFSRDGQHLVYPQVAGDRSDLWWVDITSSGYSAPKLLLSDGSRNVGPVFCPRSSLVAYSSDRSGQDEVYLRRFPPTDERWRLTPDGGFQPTWSADGSELFYRAPDGGVWSVSIRAEPEVTVGAPRKLIDPSQTGAVAVRGFEASRDGRRILVVRRSDAGHNMHLIVVRDWLSEFAR
jgi:Tol biopolymer transport system component